MGYFISGLKENIRADVQACTPVTLSAAIGLARLYEARNNSIQHATQLEVGKSIPNLPLEANPSPMPIKRLSPSELQDRRDKGLCFNCNDKFGPGHRCKKLFLIEGRWFDEEDEGGGMKVPEVEAMKGSREAPEISNHAPFGT